MNEERAKKVLQEQIDKYGQEYDEEGIESLEMAIKALEQESITWIVGKDDCQVAVRNMPIDKMQKICAIIGEKEQQPCEEEVPNCTECRYYDKEKHYCPRFCRVIEDTMAEITLEQTRPKGKWIFHKPFEDGCKNCNECIECSRCHIWLGYDCYAKTLYCPNCGAEMEG